MNIDHGEASQKFHDSSEKPGWSVRSATHPGWPLGTVRAKAELSQLHHGAFPIKLKKKKLCKRVNNDRLIGNF